MAMTGTVGWGKLAERCQYGRKCGSTCPCFSYKAVKVSRNWLHYINKNKNIISLQEIKFRYSPDLKQ